MCCRGDHRKDLMLSADGVVLAWPRRSLISTRWPPKPSATTSTRVAPRRQTRAATRDTGTGGRSLCCRAFACCRGAARRRSGRSAEAFSWTSAAPAGRGADRPKIGRRPTPGRSNLPPAPSSLAPSRPSRLPRRCPRRPHPRLPVWFP